MCLITNSTCSSLECRKTTPFCLLFFCFASLLCLSREVLCLVDSLCMKYKTIMSTVNKTSFMSFFPIYTPVLYFFYLPILARTSSMMLKRSSEKGKRLPSTCPLCERFYFSSSMMLPALPFYEAIMKLRTFPSIS